MHKRIIILGLIFALFVIANTQVDKIYNDDTPAFIVPPDTFVFVGWKNYEKQWKRIKRDSAFTN